MKKFLMIVGIIIVAIVAINWLGEDEETDEVVANVGDDTYTLMVYMCASDLESVDGCASNDITEMLQAKTDSKAISDTKSFADREYDTIDLYAEV